MKLFSELKFKINYSKQDIYAAIKRKYGIFSDEILHFEIIKESLDARKKPDVFVVLSVAAELKNSASKKANKLKDVVVDHNGINPVKENYNGRRPIVVGFGPSGMFVGLYLALAGFKPIILEQGKNVDERQVDVDNFWENRKLNKYSNIQFGEGGAGTFSDGKLNSNVSNEYTKKCINELILNGAPPEIFYSFAPHIGSDKLKTVVKNIRKKIIANGGEILFNTHFDEFNLKNNKIVSVNITDVLSGGSRCIECGALILTVGHSALDVYKMLKKNNVKLAPKPFAMGVRIEQSQQQINFAQYGKMDSSLPAANYKLVEHLPNGRSVFTFCMCPGGYVVASSCEDGGIITNGMSRHARDGANANAAVLVNVLPEDYYESDVLDGAKFQRKFEKLAFELGGKNYNAPAEKVKDFLSGKENFDTEDENFSEQNLVVKPTYKPGIKWADLSKCLPDFVTHSLREALPKFDKKVKGFAAQDNILIGVESRSSAPIQITRDENFMASVSGLFVAGEGAGYAGGITSSAQDGIKCAEKVVNFLKNK